MDLGRIFEPFYTTKKHGSGMGLAVCQRIMEEHNGWISIERHLVGTAFEVWLPVPPDPAPPEG
jgi:signal transduction histidine kinase